MKLENGMGHFQILAEWRETIRYSVEAADMPAAVAVWSELLMARGSGTTLALELASYEVQRVSEDGVIEEAYPSVELR